MDEVSETKKKSPLVIWVLVVIIVLVIVVALLLRKSGSQTAQNAAPTQTTLPSQVPTAVAVPSGNIYLIKTDAKKGAYLTDFAGMTLYTFDKDTPGVSNCTGVCATKWKPYTSGATAQKEFPTNIAVLKRADGTLQFSYKGAPLYYYVSDTAVGDIKGDGVGGLWHLVKP